MTEDSGSATSAITIKKYATRRLYNTATSSYVTLDHLCQMVKDGQDFVVFDAKTGEDITRQVLTQIIVEEEQKSGHNLLPIGFLRQLIGFYGNNLQWLVPRYLDASMQTVARNQELEFLTQAIQSLPDRCRQIFTLRKIYNLSQAEIATRLGISEFTVSAQLTIGVHKCTEFFARHRREARD